MEDRAICFHCSDLSQNVSGPSLRLAVMLRHVVAERATQIRAKSTLTRGSGKSYTYVRKVLTLLALTMHTHHRSSRSGEVLEASALVCR
jgi:hypothetical protein